MPPLFSSTNWTTVLRRVAHAAKNSFSSKVLPIAPRLSRAQRARIALRQALYEAYPSLSTSGYAYARINPAQHVSRTFASVPGASALNPLRYASNNVRMAPFRNNSLMRGPGMVANLGLQPARSFSSFSPGHQVTNARMVLRALADNMNDDFRRPNRARPSRYTPYECRHRKKRSRLAIGRIEASLATTSSRSFLSSIASSCISWGPDDTVDVAKAYTIADLDHFFPTRGGIATPPHADELVTPGYTSVLSIGLAPSLEEILRPTTNVSYSDAEVGLSVLAKVLQDILPLHQAYEIHRSHRVLPLLNKMESMGLLDTVDIIATTAELAVLRDAEGRPEILQITFPNRSADDVRAILGESLAYDGEEIWFALSEQPPVPPMRSDAWLEDWDSGSGSSEVQYGPSVVVQAVTPALVMPVLDASSEAFSWSHNADPVELSTSDGFATPASDVSSTSSLSSGWRCWSVSPSDMDSDLDSSVGDLSEMSDVDEVLSEFESASERVDSRPPSPSVEIRWAGDGFGFAQPW